MNDTLRDHTIETQQTGYDKLASDSKEALDETIQALNANADEQEKIVKRMLNNIKGEYDTVYKEINNLIESTGTAIGTTANDALGPNGLKSSVESSLKPIGESVTAWLNDLGKKVEAFNINVSKIADFNTENYMEAQRVSGILKSLKITSTKDDVKNARSEYDKLTDEQKKLVSKDVLKLLTDNEKRIKDEEAAAKKEAAAAAEAEARRKADEETRKKAEAEAKADEETRKKAEARRKADEARKKAEAEAAEQVAKDNYRALLNEYKNTSQTFGSNSKEAITVADNVTKARSQLDFAQAQVEKVSNTKSSNTTKTMTSVKNSSSSSAINNDPVRKIILGLSDRSVITSADEKKKHSELWTHIVQKWGKAIHDKQIVELAKALNVSLSANTIKNKKPTDKEKATILKKLIQHEKNHGYGYAKGTLGTKRDEINWTHEGEIIRMSDGAILRQLPQGTQVIPKLESQNLMKWAQMDPSKWIHDGINTNVIKNNESGGNITVHYDSLLTVNGDVTRDALPELQEILKRSYEYTTAQIKREARKSGIR